MCPVTYSDHHTSRLEPQIIVMRSDLPSRIIGQHTLVFGVFLNLHRRYAVVRVFDQEVNLLGVKLPV